MDRREFLVSVASGLLAAPLAVGAQPAGKIARMGLLYFGDPPLSPAQIAKSPFWSVMNQAGVGSSILPRLPFSSLTRIARARLTAASPAPLAGRTAR